MSLVTFPMTTGDTLLDYGVSVFPSPLQVSPAEGDPALGAISLVVSNGTSNPIYCTKIQITLPLGDLAQDLSPADDAASVHPVASPLTKWKFDPPTASGVLTAHPTKPEYAEITTDGISLQINNISMNQQVGTFELDLVETSYAQGGTSQPHNGSFQIPKFPYGFMVSNFTASSPEVNEGDTVTLTWTGSEGATYTIRYDQEPWQPTTGRSWISPALYTTTVFMLHAEVSEGGETVAMDLPPLPVTVAAPQVLQFYSTPSPIDYQEVVTLHWRAVNADGVYFVAGQTPAESLAPVSDPNNPKTIQPQYGVAYQLQAYKNTTQGPFLSPVTNLPVVFYPLAIVSFAANPTTVDINNQSTILSWVVEHAQSVSYQGRNVSLVGTSNPPERPTSTTTYQLVATWVDGTQHAAPPVTVNVLNVQVDGYSVQFTQSGTDITAVVKFTTANASSGAITRSSLLFSDRHHWYIWGNHYETPVVSMAAVQLDSTTWQCTLQFNNIPGNVINYPNVGLSFDYSFQGYEPVATPGNISMWRGSLTFQDSA
jgi:hypothetical protein